MENLINGLSFKTLRDANKKRIPQFKNSKGFLAHSKSDGSDWTPAQWLQAVIGELGEYANIRKKFERGDIEEKEFKSLAEKELADVQIYLDILAYRLEIDLGKATIDKFNDVSDRINSTIYISYNDFCYDARDVIIPKENKENKEEDCNNKQHEKPQQTWWLLTDLKKK